MKKLRQEFADTMVEVGKKDPRLVVMVGDISHGILQNFAKSCPGRYFNIGICEPTIVNMAAGIFKTGLIPVVHTIAPFIIERAYEQIKLDFGYQRYGINLVSVGNAFDYAQLGCSHHCYTDISLLGHFKRANIFCPASPVEFNELFKKVYDNGEINYFRLTEYPHEVEFSPKQIAVGEAIYARKGKDVTIVALGRQLKTALEAARELAYCGIEVEILYYPTVKPFDEKKLKESVRKTKKVLVIEEASSSDGLFRYVLVATQGLGNVVFASYLQPGTIILFDDFVNSSPSPDINNHSERKALIEFLSEHKDIQLIHLFPFGWHGYAFMVISCNGAYLDNNIEKKVRALIRTPELPDYPTCE